MLSLTCHLLIEALNFRGTGNKLRSLGDGLTWCLPFIPVLAARGRNPCSVPTRQVLLVVVIFFLCTLWIFIAIASMLLSADLPLTSVGVLLVERVWNARLRAPSSVQLEGEFCPELFTCTRV